MKRIKQIIKHSIGWGILMGWDLLNLTDKLINTPFFTAVAYYIIGMCTAVVMIAVYESYETLRKRKRDLKI